MPADRRLQGQVDNPDGQAAGSSIIRERRHDMPKVVRCGDVMPGCTALMEGRDDAEVIRKVMEHAKSAHGMAAVPPDVADKVRAAIKIK